MTAAAPEATAKALEAPAMALAKVEGAGAGMIRDLVGSLSIDTPGDHAFAVDLVRDVQAEWSRLDAIRKGWTGPLANVQRSINGAFKGPLEALAAAEQEVKGKIAAYHAQVESRRIAAMVAQAPAEAPAEARGVNVRTVRKWRVTDAGRVPRQFCSPDPHLIQAHLDAGGLEAIPGVEWYDQDVVTVRK